MFHATLRSSAQVCGSKREENEYNALVSNLARARQSNKYSAARGSRMRNWMSPQTAFISKVAPEGPDGADPLLVCDVLRPICSSHFQVVLYKNDEGGILTFKLGLIYAVFCRSLVAAKGVGRKLKVSKCLGINSPCEAVAHVLVLDLHELSEDTFVTSLLQPAHLMVPSNDIVCEVSCAMSGEKAGKMFFGFEKSTLALIAEIQEGKHSALQVFLPKKTPSATPHASGKSDPAPAAVEDHVGFTPLDFPKGQVGQRNVRTFVTKLLEVYKSKGVNLVTNVITAGTHWLRELRFSLRPWLRQGIRARTRMFIHRACVANSLSVSAGTPEFLFFNMFQSFISAVL